MYKKYDIFKKCPFFWNVVSGQIISYWSITPMEIIYKKERSREGSAGYQNNE